MGVSASTRAGTVTYDFTTDPTTGATPIQVFSGFLDSNSEPVYWKDAGGNPGGFLGLTWSIGSSSSIILFPDIDQGKIVTAFTLETDLRVGNPQQVERAADGFSINFARSNDPVFENHAASDFATSGAVETGTRTGIAISFDTWSGNTLPDGADIEGIIVRVDNKTVLRQPMPTRNGACDDPTSLQTGPRNTPYWEDPETGAKALGTLPDAAFVPASWTNLCWQHLIVDVDDQAKLSVTFKGKKLLDKFQTTFFPSAGGIVLAGRTGNADEQTHFDNLKLTTTATAIDTEKPTLPANLKAAQTGAYRVELAWDASTDNSGRVGYDVEQDGVALGTSGTPDFIARGLSPNTSYVFRVRSTDVSGNKSEFISLTVKTIAEVPDPTRASLKIYGTTDSPISGAAMQALLDDGRYPDAPDRVAGLNGMVMSFGEPNFGDTFGENLGFRIAGTITPSETAQYRFFVRSDDASQLYLNQTDATIPVADGTSQVAEETDCCDAFLEPGVANDDTTTFATSQPISLTAGKAYGILYIVKEGGGGDWGQVAWRKEGNTNAAAGLAPISGPIFKSESVPNTDPLGVGLPAITTQPQDGNVAAGGTATFVVAAGFGETPFSYAWQFNGTTIPGATNATLTISNATAANAGAYQATVANGVGSVTSRSATLTVGGGTTGPVFASFAKTGSNLVLTWTAGTLEEAASVTGPWTAVANATSPATVAITGAQKFLRLK